MDLETCCRYNLPIIFVIINNNGIYSGIEKNDWRDSLQEAREQGDQGIVVPKLASTGLIPDARYEKIVEAFGGIGFFVKTPGTNDDRYFFATHLIR